MPVPLTIAALFVVTVLAFPWAVNLFARYLAYVNRTFDRGHNRRR
ncbi:hypothetical protein [Streptomyces longhuiensis]|nr:hypothetical protein [Streptomyces longhuiensis]